MPQMTPGRVQRWLIPGLQVFLLVVAMSSPPSARKWAIARWFTRPGGLHQNGYTRARNWTRGSLGGWGAQHYSIVTIIWKQWHSKTNPLEKELKHSCSYKTTMTQHGQDMVLLKYCSEAFSAVSKLLKVYCCDNEPLLINWIRVDGR